VEAVLAQFFTDDELETIFRKYVFKFIANDIARQISRAYTEPSENVLCAIGLMTYTEFLGWIDRRASGVTADPRHENRDCFNHFLRLMGPEYVALMNSGFNVWKIFRNSLIHEYAVRQAIDVFLPARKAPCGIYRDPTSQRFGLWCGRYFTDFYKAACSVYARQTGRTPPRMPPLRRNIRAAARRPKSAVT
jgi:hypothetical protein